MKFIMTLLLLGLSLPTRAEGQWYACEVRQFYVLDDRGGLNLKAGGYEGKTFSVNRSDNVMVGAKINTLYHIDVVASNPTGPGVYSRVNYRRRENGQIRRLSSLTMQDFGDSKPFVLSEGNYLFTGLCR